LNSFSTTRVLTILSTWSKLSLSASVPS
jgi:hypothetical protein